MSDPSNPYLSQDTPPEESAPLEPTVLTTSDADPYQSPVSTELTQPQQPPYYAPVAPTSGMAIVSLVLGIMSVPSSCSYGIGLVLAVPAIITGNMARREVARSQGTIQGDGLALAGVVLGWVGAGIAALWILMIGGFISLAIFSGTSTP